MWKREVGFWFFTDPLDQVMDANGMIGIDALDGWSATQWMIIFRSRLL